MSEEISKYEVFNKYEEAKKLLLIDYDINKDKRYLVAIEALEKQLSGGWIPVSERLPKEDEEVLVTTIGNQVYWAFRYLDYGIHAYQHLRMSMYWHGCHYPSHIGR